MDDKHYKAFVQIGLNILYYRKEQGLTQQELAEMTSFSRNHIQQIETAKATPSVAAAYRYRGGAEYPCGKTICV